MNIHFIAIGGAVMHNLAIALHLKGYRVTGSDDEIFEPSRSRLQEHGLLPESNGFDADRVTSDLDAVILGMHARADNPELQRARELDLKIYSFPEYLYEQSREKKRVVIGGSHGKTTITSIVMHILKECGYDFDYMVGSQIEGFDTMVRITEKADLIILEGDEYLSSPVDPRPKFHLYHPHLALLSGIAWDHMNVFPTSEIYREQFRRFLNVLEPGGKLFYYRGDPELAALMKEAPGALMTLPYTEHPYQVSGGEFVLLTAHGPVGVKLFGKHNMQNIMGAQLICRELGITDEEYYRALPSFRGAKRRQQLLAREGDRLVYLDFAHAPSKVRATVEAFREMYPGKKLVACLELHTFSSLNKDFLPRYSGSLDRADIAYVYFNPEVVRHKKLPELSRETILRAFGRTELAVYTNASELVEKLGARSDPSVVFLIMTSGNFSGLDLEAVAKKLVTYGT